jgi:hypothetical protein
VTFILLPRLILPILSVPCPRLMMTVFSGTERSAV